MKKLVAMLVALTVLGAGSLFAFNADLQIHLGGEAIEAYPDFENDTRFEVGAFNLSLENYNMWELGSLISLGIMENLTGTFGGITKYEIDTRYGTLEYDAGDFDKSFVGGFGLIVGPAVGFCLGDVVDLRVMLGFQYRFTQFAFTMDFDDAKEDKLNINSLGVATGIQAKFLPHKKVSPLVGFRYGYTAFTEFDEYYDDEETNTSGDYAIEAHTFTVDLGVSFNFGK